MANLLRRIEELLSLAEASRLLPNRPHVSTLWRWCRRGVKGVRLQTVIVGGRRYTTAAFLSDFVAQLRTLGRKCCDRSPVTPTSRRPALQSLPRPNTEHVDVIL